MNIGLLIRGVKAGAKLAGRGAKATGRGAKAGAKATARKTKGAVKAVGKTKVAKAAKRVGGKVAEGVGYAATPGLKRGAKTGRYFMGGGSRPLRSIAKSQVKRTGKRVIAGASVLAGGGEAARRKSKSKKEAAAAAAAAKSKRDAAAAKARAATPKTPTRAATPKTPAKKAVKTPAKKAVKRALPAYARLGKKPTASRKSRFENMTTYQKNRLKGRDLVAYRNYLKSKKK